MLDKEQVVMLLDDLDHKYGDYGPPLVRQTKTTLRTMLNRIAEREEEQRKNPFGTVRTDSLG